VAKVAWFDQIVTEFDQVTADIAALRAFNEESPPRAD
jgi:hypothetical protein